MNPDDSFPKPADWIPATFRALLEAAPDAMVIVDHEGRIVLANKQAAILFGYSDGELHGQKVEDTGTPAFPFEASWSQGRILR